MYYNTSQMSNSELRTSVNFQMTFIAINVIGGLFVLGGYVLTLSVFPQYRESLWGGIHGGLRHWLVISMILAACGYLTFSSLVILRGISAIEPSLNAILGNRGVNLMTLVFLSSAALWMPLSVAYLHSGNQLLWLLTVSVLWVTALSLFVLTLIVAAGGVSGFSFVDRVISTAGLATITFHCLVMDGLIWVIRFHR